MPSWLEYMDKQALFPGLIGSNIDDKYIQTGYEGIYILCILTVVVGVVTIIGGGFRHIYTRTSRSSKIDGTKEIPLIIHDLGEEKNPACRRESFNMNKSLSYFAGLSLAILVVYLMLLPHIQSMDVDSYFICEGATNAMAIGDTWPIPSCFEDKTG